jgi:ABC-type Fe3+/spermidine/putrescine transport system ATPase subunit
LLDEPLSNLDAALREEMRLEMGRLLKEQNITAIYVTHDRLEALAMADEIVVMRDGHVAQIGAPEELYSRPNSGFIAGFLGAANFLRGEVVPGADRVGAVRHGALCLRGRMNDAVTGKGVIMARPEDVVLHGQPPADGDNVLPGQVVHSEFLGASWRHVVTLAPDVTMHVLTSTRAPAERIWLQFPPERCLLLPDTQA